MKYILLSLLTVSLIFGAYQLYTTQTYAPTTNNNDNNSQEETLNSRPFFKRWGKKQHENKLQAGENDIPEIITYGVNFSIDVDQNERSNQFEEASQSMKVTAQCDVQTIYDEDLNIFDIAVSYTMVNKHDSDTLKQDSDSFVYNDDEVVFEETDEGMYVKGTIPEKETVEEVVQQQNQFFLLQVNANSGEILSLKIESVYEEDQIVTYMTEQLINDIFPELRKDSYSLGNIEEDNLGAAKVDYIQEEIDENHIAITKEYDQHDYVQTEVDLTIPESDYDRVVIMEKDTGLVSEGMTEYKFALGDTNEAKLQQSEGDEEIQMDLEILGKIQGEMKSNFWIVQKTVKDIQIAKEMFRYRSEATFEPKKLSKKMKAEMELGGEEVEFDLVDIFEEDKVILVDDDSKIANENTNTIIVDTVTTEVINNEIFVDESSSKLSTARQTFSETKELAGTKVLGKQIGIDFIYSGTTETSTVALKVKVGSSYITTIAQKSFNNCKSSERQNITEKSIVFFKATFPVLGIITVPVSAQGKFSYGWTTSVVTQTRFCQLNITPFFKAGIYADGKVSLANIISAGVYAQGNLLDANLTLSATTQAGKSAIALNGNFLAFSFEMGIVYDKFSCSLSNLKSEEPVKKSLLPAKKLQGFFKKIVKAVKTVTKVVHQVKTVATKVVKAVTNITKICKKTPGYINIAKFSTGAKKLTIWNKSVPYGI